MARGHWGTGAAPLAYAVRSSRSPDPCLRRQTPDSRSVSASPASSASPSAFRARRERAQRARGSACRYADRTLGRRSLRSAPRGFALPLAVAVLIAVTLAMALVLDGALAAFRSGSADLQASRAEMAAESALAAALGTRFDPAARAAGAGTVLVTAVTAGRDSVSTLVQVVEPAVVRIVVSATRMTGRVRSSAGRMALARLRIEPSAPAEALLVPIGPAWWVPVP